MARTTPTVMRPPLVDGVAEATARDQLVSLVWQLRGYRYEWTHGGPRFQLAMMMFGWVFAVVPLLVPIVLLRLRSTRSRYYRNGHAIVGVIAKRAVEPTWLVGDHGVATQRRGHGRALRDALLPTLLSVCDQHGIHLEADTRSVRMAHQYAAELPGATITRRRTGSYQIRRAPRAAADQPGLS